MNALTLVENGQCKAHITLSAAEDEQVLHAARLLVEYVAKAAGGATLPIRSEAEVNRESTDCKVSIVLGLASLREDLKSELTGLHDEGFIIHSQDKQIYISGKSSWGTTHGIYEFLERYVGVRWLMPGEVGEDVPQSSTIRVPYETVKQQPAFMSRSFSPLKFPDNSNGPLHYEWALRNRLPYRFNAHHNLTNLFDPEKFGLSNPEFYPLRKGVRYIPPVGINYEWQPDFSNPATVKTAIAEIIHYFDENPQELGYSLGVNDSSGFCEEEPDHPNYTQKLNSKGFVDMSDIYYRWVNEVVTGVLEVKPDKWFGLLAYENVIDPPSFPLHPRVVPVITKDRMSWIDPEVAAKDQQQMAAWKKVTTSIGWYDYIYGSPYMIPRMYLHLMAENYRYSQRHEVAVHYAELYPNWGEGPKPWVATKLLWNPNEDVDALINKWYVRAVGHQAAPYLAAYYDHWEYFWNERIKASSWFQESKNLIYLLFPDPRYLEIVTDDEMAESKKRLEAAVYYAETDVQKARAQMLLTAFEYYELSVLSYPRTCPPLADAAEALAMLADGAITRRVELAKQRMQVVEKLKADPLLKHSRDPEQYAAYGLVWSGWNAQQFWRLADFVKNGGQAGKQVHERIKELSESAEAVPMRQFSGLLLQAVTGTLPILVYAAQANGLISDHGDEGACIASQHVSIKTGLLAGRAYYRCRLGAAEGVARMTVSFLDSEDQSLFEIHAEKRKIAAAAENWSSFEILEDISVALDVSRIKKMQIFVKVSPPLEENSFWLGDLEFYQ